jgi:hypothetical protein
MPPHGQDAAGGPAPRARPTGRPRKAAAGPSHARGRARRGHISSVIATRRKCAGRGKLRRPCGGKPCRTRGPPACGSEAGTQALLPAPWRPGCAHAAVAPRLASMRTRRAASAGRAQASPARLEAGGIAASWPERSPHPRPRRARPGNAAPAGTTSWGLDAGPALIVVIARAQRVRELAIREPTFCPPLTLDSHEPASGWFVRFALATRCA